MLITVKYGPTDKDYIDDALLGTGAALRSLSFFVMRADYLPPRKSCIKRRIESILSYVKEVKAQPKPIPVPQTFYAKNR